MKSLEIILRLLDQLVKAIFQRKAQGARDELEKNPGNWFADHFDGGVRKPAADDKADKADT